MRAILIGAMLLLAGSAAADIVPAHLEFEGDQAFITLTVVPDGSGPGFAGARLESGALWSRPLRLRPWVWVWGGPDEPVPLPGFPAEDVFFVTDDGGAACPGQGHPDGPSDADGWFTWSDPVAAGGDLAAGATVHLVLAGQPFDEPLPLAFRSPDLNGDRTVDLVDIVLFTAALAGASGVVAADFNVDGVVNLSDIVIFTPAIGANCP